jgi:hypothetical protein
LNANTSAAHDAPSDPKETSMFHAIRAIALLLAAACLTTPARALVNRAYVSGAGVDNAACGAVSTPCRTLQFVHDRVVNDGGEIDIVGPGEFGPLVITKSLTIANKGVGVASIAQPGSMQSAVQIKGAASDIVTLRGLTIDGGWTAATGVFFQSGATLEMIDCVLRHFKSLGVYATPSPGGKVLLENVTLSDMTSGGALIAPTGAFTGFAQGLKVTNAPNGFELSGRNAASGAPVYMLVADSYGAGTSNAFMSTSIEGMAVPTLALDAVHASGNGIGVIANRGNLRLSNSTIVGNATGVSLSLGGARSNRSNVITDNGANVLGGTIASSAPN